MSSTAFSRQASPDVLFGPSETTTLLRAAIDLGAGATPDELRRSLDLRA